MKRTLLWFVLVVLISAPAVFAETIRCESDRGHRHECSFDGLGRVELSRQISRTDCVEGRTWGTAGRHTVWVSDGCRADFRHQARAGRGSGRSSGPPRARALDRLRVGLQLPAPLRGRHPVRRARVAPAQSDELCAEPYLGLRRPRNLGQGRLPGRVPGRALRRLRPAPRACTLRRPAWNLFKHTSTHIPTISAATPAHCRRSSTS